MENFREYTGKKEDWSLETLNYEGVRVNTGGEKLVFNKIVAA